MQIINTQPRNCECCGGNNLEFIWNSETVIVRAKYSWNFPSSVVVCRNCGFAFNSPCPSKEDLLSFYADGLTGYKEISPPYSIDARIKVLEKFSGPHKIFAEIGGDQPDEFHRRCSSLFKEVLLVDINEDSSAALKSMYDLSENSLDVIAHYDVLEHIPDIKDFLALCYRALKPGGVMVCEVPDIRLYPRNLLLQECTHVNHFSTTTLAGIVSKAGMTPIEMGHMCSRPYGFLTIFQKQKTKSSYTSSMYEYLDALACLKGGIAQIQLCKKQIECIRDQITSKRQKIIIWAVTDLLRSLLENFELPSHAIIIDSDPRRKNHLKDLGITVHQPADVIEYIINSDLLVICAPRYRSEIVEWIELNTGKIFSGHNLQVIGSGPFGETLR